MLCVAQEHDGLFRKKIGVRSSEKPHPPPMLITAHNNRVSINLERAARVASSSLSEGIVARVRPAFL
jgi:hypothetical protein